MRRGHTPAYFTGNRACVDTFVQVDIAGAEWNMLNEAAARAMDRAFVNLY
jgi:hypothetical protein